MLEPADLARLNAALLERPGRVPTVVAALRVAILACTARRHPYGFVVVALGSRNDTERVVYRLHIWPEGFRLPGSADLMIHDHVYEITSHVLVGRLVQHEYEQDPMGEDYACYRGLYDGPHSVLERSPDSMRVRERAITCLEAGATYTLPPGALHMVRVDPAVFTATVLRTQYDDQRTDPIILAPLSALSSYRFDRDLMSDVETKFVVEEFFRRLAQITAA